MRHPLSRHLILTVAFFGSAAMPLSAQSKPILRLQPLAFAALPAAVRAGLVRIGCSVPQSYLAKTPENATAGSFTRRGVKEWAVLCSLNGVSEILIFNIASPEPVSRLGRLPDGNFVQVVGPGRTGYSRRISTVPALSLIHI